MNNHSIIPFYLWLVTIMIILSGCAGKRHMSSVTKPATAQEWAHYLFDTSGVHSGLYMIEAEPTSHNTKPLIDYQSTSLFTPASNTKILTLYTALKFLPQRLQGLQWMQRNDTTYIRGTGDPGFLDPRFDTTPVMQFLNRQDRLVLVSDWTSDDRWGPGWSWDDYFYYYAAQRSPFPMYGNVVRAWCKERNWSVKPDGFIVNRISDPLALSVKRNENSNVFQVNPTKCSEDTTYIPFDWTPRVAARLLSDTLHRPVNWVRSVPDNQPNQWKTHPGTNRDTLLRTMMYDSDNLIAEQLLMNASSTLWNSYNPRRIIDSLMVTDFQDWQNKIRWVDGSGLSVYNKLSPRFLVEILSRLYDSMPQKQLFRYFAAGGVRGTVSSWYGNDGGSPYVYAKTGTLSGVHCLSGYLITDSGKTFIFSFMHNNYVGSSSQYKTRMEKLLRWMKENY